MHLHAFIAALLLCLAFPSFSNTADTSPQLCYFGKNQVASADIIPCFEGGPISPCCMKGSNCLANNACWDPASGVSYQYGCTDKAYKDDKCPKKCGYDTGLSPWIGLVYCGGERIDSGTKAPNNTWLCHHPENCGGPDTCPSETVWPATPAKLHFVTCSQLLEPNATAFSQGNPIPSILVLPKDTLGLASYFSAHSIATSTGSASTVTSSASLTSQTASTLTTIAATSTTLAGLWPAPSPTDKTPNDSFDDPESNSSLNLGLGVGIGIPAFFILSGLIGYYSWRSRKHAKPTTPPDPPTPNPGMYTVGDGSPGFGQIKPELDSTPIASPTTTHAGTLNGGDGKGVFELESPQTSPAPAYQEFRHQLNNKIFEMEGTIPERPVAQELP